ncbi:MAG: hypothetical protein JSS65_01025 [Armatimonadetes bacterium]|nr:hypothetical protein [Armatimonadota bacterium]
MHERKLKASSLVVAISLMATMTLTACKAESDDKPVASPPLSGEQPAKLVGKWETKEGAKSAIELKADGSTHIVAEASFRGDKMTSDVTGTWAVTAGKLAMRRKGPDGLDFTIEYEYALVEGDKTLELSRKGTKGKQVYKKAGE